MAVFGSGIWGILIIVGPIVLAAAIIWAMVNNRQSRNAERHTEDATHRLYEAEDEKNKEAGR